MNLPIIKKRKIADNTYEVAFGLGDEKFPFEAGQYVQIVLPDPKDSNSLGISRDFSLVNSPLEKKELIVTFRASDSVFKKMLLEMPMGTDVEISGPFGSFTLPDSTRAPLIFIAGGVGIAPYMSMLRFVSEQKLQNKILLLSANRNKKSAAYNEELKQIKKENPNVSVVNKFGRLVKSSLVKYISKNTEAKVYIAGPPEMVENTRKLVVEIGIQAQNIRTEEFTGEKDDELTH